MLNAEAVLEFWFGALVPEQWFRVDAAVDREIVRRFSDLHRRAAQCELYEWRRAPRGRLAEIITLDQFSRNLFRGDAAAYACDALSLALAQEAVALGMDTDLSPNERSFLYMPYMHSESPAIHEVAVRLFDQPGLENNLAFEIRHKVVIDRFGRYPHRNAVLGRESTPEEIAFLKDHPAGF